jgi:pyruvate/2-oxoglutarate dehydrogenase complex dihydrolipoamide dehydrogenase (E3) component
MRYRWTIIGAGPAGILAIGQLLTHGVSKRKILWLDDEFFVGRLGRYYRNVPSNDYVYEWIDMLAAYPCFDTYIEELRNYHPQTNQPLAVIVSILSRITESLKQHIKSRRCYVDELKFTRNHWSIQLKHKHRPYTSRNIILATGSHPISLNYTIPITQCDPICHTIQQPVNDISLDTAIDRYELARLISPHDCVAVIGSGQSAILLLMFLQELGVRQVVNLYTISHDETLASLKAETLEWAQQHLASVQRVYNDDRNREQWLSQCNKVIYAVGYERNSLPRIRHASVDLDNNQGILGPHLFGVGIAFPEKEQQSDGRWVRRVGMTSFTRFLCKNVPVWLDASTLS